MYVRMYSETSLIRPPIIRQTHYSALVFKERIKMYMFNIHLIRHLPIPPFATIFDDKIVVLPDNFPRKSTK